MTIYRLRAFPNAPNGGNKAGVVLDANKITTTRMQEIAKTVGYSETAFVLDSLHADFMVRFFTPTNEVDLCGHATIATFNLLRDVGMITPGTYTQETKAGILKLRVEEDMVYMEQNLPQFFEQVTKEDISNCFDEDDFIDTRYPIQVVSTGIKEIFVPIKSVELLHKLTPNIKAITSISTAHDTIGIHAFALDSEVDAYGRNFAPVVGIDEESATGTSNGALSCYLYNYGNKKESYILRQGYNMNEPSEIYASLDLNDHTISAVWVGGRATRINEEM